MLHVTAGAIGLAGGGSVGARVKSGVCIDATPDLDVTVQALEPPGAISEIVALSAFRHSLQRTVRT
jgi:hypothetical protein